MSCQPISPPLTDEQKGRICGILSVGCDRQTAADFVGCSLAAIRHTMRQDADFLANLRRAEASVELSHMRNVQQAAQEKKDWKASIWWLECRSPERFARRSGMVTIPQLKAFVTILIDTLSSEVTNIEDRRRFMARLRQLTESVEQLLRDSHSSAFDLAKSAPDSTEDATDSGPTEFITSHLLDLQDESQL